MPKKRMINQTTESKKMTNEEKEKLKKKYVCAISKMESDSKIRNKYGTNGPKMSNYMSPSLAMRK